MSADPMKTGHLDLGELRDQYAWLRTQPGDHAAGLASLCVFLLAYSAGEHERAVTIADLAAVPGDAGPAVNVPARVAIVAIAALAGEQQQRERDRRHAVLVEHYAPAPEYRHLGAGDRYALVCVESGHGLDGTLVTTHATVIDACEHAGTLVCDGWEPVAVFDLDERTAVNLIVGAPAVSVGTAVADPGNILKTETP